MTAPDVITVTIRVVGDNLTADVQYDPAWVARYNRGGFWCGIMRDERLHAAILEWITSHAEDDDGATWIRWIVGKVSKTTVIG